MAKLEPWYFSKGAPFGAFNIFDGDRKARYLGTAGTPENLPTGGKRVVRLAFTHDTWIEADAAAAVPSADEASGSSVFYPAGSVDWLVCEGVTNISCVSDVAGAAVSADFFD